MNIPGFEAVTRGFQKNTRGFDSFTRGFEAFTRGFQIITRGFHTFTRRAHLLRDHRAPEAKSTYAATNGISASAHQLFK